MMNVWSAYHDAGLSLITVVPTAKPNPTYYALSMYSDYGDTIVSTESNVSRISAHASSASRTGKITLVIINRAFAAQTFGIVFNKNPDGSPHSITLDTGSRTSRSWTMPAQGFAVLVYNHNLNLIQSREYDRARSDAGLPLQVTP